MLRGGRYDLHDDLPLGEIHSDILDFPWAGDTEALRLQLAIIHRRTIQGPDGPISFVALGFGHPGPEAEGDGADGTPRELSSLRTRESTVESPTRIFRSPIKFCS